MEVLVVGAVTSEVIGWSADLGSRSSTSDCLLDEAMESSVSLSLMFNTDGRSEVVFDIDVSN